MTIRDLFKAPPGAVGASLSAGFGTPVTPPLISEEDGHENDSGRDTEAHGETDRIAAQQGVCKQRHARTGDDAVDEGDHAGGAGRERDECAKPWLWLRVGFRPASALSGEVRGSFRRERAVIAANARYASEELHVLDTGVDETNNGEQTEHEQGGKYGGGKEAKRRRELRYESHSDEGTRQCKDVEGCPRRGFADRRVRRCLEHEVLGGQRRHERRLPLRCRCVV